MTSETRTRTTRLVYNRTIGVAAMQGRGFYYPWSAAVADDGKIFVLGSPGEERAKCEKCRQEFEL